MSIDFISKSVDLFNYSFVVCKLGIDPDKFLLCCIRWMILLNFVKKLLYANNTFSFIKKSFRLHNQGIMQCF